MAKLVGVLYRKEELLEKIQDCVEYVSANCFYCNNCWNCLVTKKFRKDASEKKLKTSDKQWWSIEWKTGENPTPFLVSH